MQHRAVAHTFRLSPDPANKSSRYLVDLECVLLESTGGCTQPEWPKKVAHGLGGIGYIGY